MTRRIYVILAFFIGISVGFLANDSMTKCAPIEYPDGKGQVCISTTPEGNSKGFDPTTEGDK